MSINHFLHRFRFLRQLAKVLANKRDIKQKFYNGFIFLNARFFRKVSIAWLVLITSICILLSIGELDFYKEFHQRLNSLVFEYVEKDYNRAFHCYKLAADKGNPNRLYHSFCIFFAVFCLVTHFQDFLFRNTFQNCLNEIVRNYRQRLPSYYLYMLAGGF